MDYRVRYAATLVAILVGGLALLLVSVMTTEANLGERHIGVRPSSGRAVAPGQGRPQGAMESLVLERADLASVEPVTWSNLPEKQRVQLSAVQGLVLTAVFGACLPEQGTPIDIEWTGHTGPEGLRRLEVAGRVELDAARECIERSIWRAPWVLVDGELRQEGTVQIPVKRMELERALENAQAVLDSLDGALPE